LEHFTHAEVHGWEVDRLAENDEYRFPALQGVFIAPALSG
jgi:hypothetical protein